MALLGAPATWCITGLGPEVTVRRRIGPQPDVVIAFVQSLSELRRRSQGLVKTLGPQASLWLVWPRKAGGHVSDITEQSLRDELLPTGLVDTKVAALDDDWSGLRFVWRRECRPSWRTQEL